MDGSLCPRISPRSCPISPYFQMFLCSYIYTKIVFRPTKMLHFLIRPKLTKPFVSTLNDKFPPQNGNDEDFCFIPPWDGPPGLYKSRVIYP